MTFEQSAVPRLAGGCGSRRRPAPHRSLAGDVLQDLLRKVHQGWGRIGALDTADIYVMRMLAGAWRRLAYGPG